MNIIINVIIIQNFPFILDLIFSVFKSATATTRSMSLILDTVLLVKIYLKQNK